MGKVKRIRMILICDISVRLSDTVPVAGAGARLTLRAPKIARNRNSQFC
jgi:hypothetical protein